MTSRQLEVLNRDIRIIKAIREGQCDQEIAAREGVDRKYVNGIRRFRAGLRAYGVLLRDGTLSVVTSGSGQEVAA